MSLPVLLRAGYCASSLISSITCDPQVPELQVLWVEPNTQEVLNISKPKVINNQVVIEGNGYYKLLAAELPPAPRLDLNYTPIPRVKKKIIPPVPTPDPWVPCSSTLNYRRADKLLAHEIGYRPKLKV